MLRSLGLAALLGASSVLAGVKCANSKCPESAPCCSQYGECGVGAFCLGGCDPRWSFGTDSCVPAPVCEDRSLKMGSLDRVADISKYLGDASKADWVSQGEPATFKDNTLLTMPKDSVGTVMSSTVYLWYGNVKARFKTSRGRGVVTAFILFSDVKDEIDYEFVGVDLETAQTNFYFQGIPNYKNSGNISLTDSFANFHDYEIRWTPEKIEWLIDGKVGRTQLKKDTWNATSQNFEFPQTPSRLQLSIWPGGLASNAKGTIDWAGGEMDWDHEDIKKNGYFYTTFNSVEIECYNADKPPGTNKNKSYYYNDARGTNDTVVDGDKDTILASLQGTGTDMEKGKKKDKPSASKSASASKATESDEAEESSVVNVPGVGNVGTGQDHAGSDGSSGSSVPGGSSSGSGSSSSGSGSDSSDDSTTPADTTNCDTNSFNQDCSSKSSSGSGSGSGSGNGKSESSRSSASALAIIIAGCALFWL